MLHLIDLNSLRTDAIIGRVTISTVLSLCLNTTGLLVHACCIFGPSRNSGIFLGLLGVLDVGFRYLLTFVCGSETSLFRIMLEGPQSLYLWSL